MPSTSHTLLRFLGTSATGDFGPYTLYTSQRRRFVVFIKSWPKDPATYHQQIHRNRWRHAAQRWNDLTDQVRRDWERLSVAANCCCTGYNLFIYYMIGKDRRIIETLERNTGIQVIAATGPPIPFTAA